MEAGNVSRAAMIKDIKRGFYVTEFIGMGVNGVTGDYSRGAAGYMIEDGELTYPVSEVTVAGNLVEMFAHTIPADDLVFRFGTDAPTLRIDGCTIAGK
jgi:PmbA protein